MCGPPPADLDAFLLRVYDYYRGKGFGCAVLSKLFNLLSFTWVAFLLLFIVAFFDLRTFSWDVQAAPPEGILFYCLLVMFVCVWLSLLLHSLLHVRVLLEMRWFFTNMLDITEQELTTILWSEVVDRLVAVQGLCRTGELTHLHVAQRIMRKDNYMIAMVNRDVLALCLPFFSNTRVITKSLEWSLSLSLFQVLFSDSRLTWSYEEVVNNPSLRRDLSEKLKKRFILVGLASLLLSPVIFFLLLTYFTLKYGEELRNKPHRLALHSWSRYAHWKFREFNELPHELENRLNMAVKPATAYVDQFTSPKVVLLCRFASFVFGSIVVGILVTGFFQPDILEDDIAFERSGLWWLAVCGSALAICRAFLPEDHFVFQPEVYFEEVSAQTHYLPEEWENCRAPEVLMDFCSLFPYQVQSMLLECISVLFVPLVFLFSLPGCANDIVAFVYNNTESNREVGDVCTFANFDFKKHGNPMYGSSLSAPDTDRSCDGKMEQSFLSFASRHPSWAVPEDGKEMLTTLATFQSTLSAPSTTSSVLHPPEKREPMEETDMIDSLLQQTPMELSILQRGFRSRNQDIDSHPPV